ncbi:recombinase RecT [Frigidibacter oleivorans]|uniref:recombinase RecT n=1 Tax=Frigidibacter oleivorans TaxID=2487129 RepID=UPI000F8DA089|nr:recombinase RecT [Frigidibacter oleivorans]
MSGAIEQVKQQPLRQVKSVQHLLWNDQAKNQLASVAAKHMNPERMMRIVANAIRTTPKLQACDPMSFLGALMQCASLGLEPNSALGHAYLIPFENKKKGIVEVQLVIGYKGLIDLARRSGQLAAIHGDVVYDDDELFSHEYGSNQHLRHRPGPRNGKMIGAYCYAKLNLGDGCTAEGHRFLTRDEIIRHRNQYSQGWKTAVRFGKTADSPWDEANPAFEAMAIKTAVRMMANRGELPMSIEFMAADAVDESRADYSAFAMDPTIGSAPIEGEIVEEPEERKPEAISHRQTNDQPFDTRGEARPVQETAPKPAAKPAKRERSGQPYANATAPAERDEGQALMFDHETQTAKTVVVKPDHSTNPFAMTVLRDVADMGWDEAVGFHGEELARLADSKPDLHRYILAEARAIDDTVPQ